jgi:hypothetical protein
MRGTHNGAQEMDGAALLDEQRATFTKYVAFADEHAPSR